MKISFLTPTFNRAYILPQLYHSLKRQSSTEFEWIVVDDGSTDDTEQLVKDWIKDSPEFDIIYLKQDNGGKHRALNMGIRKVRYPYTCIIDSDDYLLDDAVLLMTAGLREVMQDDAFAGIAGLRIREGGDIIGQYPAYETYVDATNIQREKLHLTGDKAEIYRSDLLKKYLFPEFPGEKFLSECAVWDRIALDGYKIRWFNQAFYVCEYRDDGLTKQVEKEMRNFQGYTYVIKQQLSYEPFIKRLALIAQYAKIAKAKGLKRKQVLELLNLSQLCYAVALTAKQIHGFLRTK